MQTSVFKYSDGTMLEFETRGWYTNTESSVRHNGRKHILRHRRISGTNRRICQALEAFGKREKIPFRRY